MIEFFLDDAQASVAQSVGIKNLPSMPSACVFNVGDTITFPGFRQMAFRVVSRQYQVGSEPGDPAWLVQLAISQTPF